MLTSDCLADRSGPFLPGVTVLRVWAAERFRGVFLPFGAADRWGGSHPRLRERRKAKESAREGAAG